MSQLVATFYGSGRKPQCPPNPAYPNGMPVDISEGATRNCSVELTHPTASIGKWLVECPICGLTVLVTAAGRIDDPSSVKIACKLGGEA